MNQSRVEALEEVFGNYLVRLENSHLEDCDGNCGGNKDKQNNGIG
jgi:hypothetical protein